MALLSIIIPVFNASATLPRTLRSLRRISSEHRALVQIVLIDDGSTDASASLIREFVESQKFPDIRPIAQANAGSAMARNAGLNVATGRWIFFLDADDELAFDPIVVLKKSVNSGATSLGLPILLRRNWFTFRWHPPRLTRATHLDVLTAKSPFYPSSLLVRADCIRMPFDPRYRYNEDWHFWMNNPRVFDDMRVIGGTVSALIHAHGGNKSSQFEARGQYRKLIADYFLAEHANCLSARQRNNLILQSRIGSLQVGERAGWDSLVQIPCDVSLYLKLLVYLILKRRLARFELYHRPSGAHPLEGGTLRQ